MAGEVPPQGVLPAAHVSLRPLSAWGAVAIALLIPHLASAQIVVTKNWPWSGWFLSCSTRPHEITLGWTGSPLATSYEYCIDTMSYDANTVFPPLSRERVCPGTWTNVGLATTVVLKDLSFRTLFFWQVRALSAEGVTYADGGEWWHFWTQLQLPPRTDVAVWRPDSGTWFIKTAETWRPSETTMMQWGIRSLGDVPVSADYDGDGRADIAVWRESNGIWYVKTSSTSFAGFFTVQWGEPGDRPVQGDYDGDHKADLAVWRPSTGMWYVRTSSSDYTSHFAIQWGEPGDRPVPADYDGDGRAEIAVWRPDSGMWYVKGSRSGYVDYFSLQWGVGRSGDIPTVGDFDGDARADIAVWRPGDGMWYVKRSRDSYSTWFVEQWGIRSLGDVPVIGDFDGDGRADITVWRPSDGMWYIKESGFGYRLWSTMQWGLAGDQPVSGAFFMTPANSSCLGRY